MDTIYLTESIEVFQNSLEEIVDSLFKAKHTHNIDLQPEIISAAKDDLKKLLSNNNFEVDKIKNSLSSKGWKENKLNCLLTVLEKKRNHLAYLSIMFHNSAYGEIIADFDWAIKIVLGTSELQTLRYPLLQLMLSIVNSDGEQKLKMYDINKDILKRIFTTLEYYE